MRAVVMRLVLPILPALFWGSLAVADEPTSSPAPAKDPEPVAAAAPAESRPGMGVTIGPVELKATGYLRAPLRLSVRSRGDGV